MIQFKLRFFSKAIALAMLGIVISIDGALATDPGFPRLMGMNIGAKNYDDPVYQAQLARLDIVILGFYRGWKQGSSQEPIRDVVHTLKHLNPHLLVGQYTILNELSNDNANIAERDKQLKLYKEGWWLTKADGTHVQWTNQYSAWDINITDWTKPDTDGLRYPQWLAKYNYHIFFESVPGFDIWYFDNVMLKQRIGFADWQKTGHDESGDSPLIQQAFRRGEAAEWKKATELTPGILLMGNADNDLSSPEYRGKLNAVFLEELMGKNWSLYNSGWEKMMARYHKVFDNLRAPRIVGFNVSGNLNNYQFLRFALSSCFLNDGYFSFTDAKKEYSSVPWFDEYEVKLGKPVETARIAPWKNGVYRRLFENGMVLVNPTALSETVTIEDGYAHFKGSQAPQTNNGLPVKTIVLAPNDGIILIKTTSGN